MLKKKIQQEKRTFYLFLVELFENLKKYKFVFGEENRILAQLIERYGKIIVNERLFSKDVVKNGLSIIKKTQPHLAENLPSFPEKPSSLIFGCSIFTLILFIDFGLFYAIRNSNYFILLVSLIIILSIIIFVGIYILIDEKFYGDSAKNKWHKEVHKYWIETANIYYKALAKSFYDFDKL